MTQWRQGQLRFHRAVAPRARWLVPAGLVSFAAGMLLEAVATGRLRLLAAVLHLHGFVAVVTPLLSRGVLQGIEEGRARMGAEGREPAASEADGAGATLVRLGVIILVGGSFWWSGAFQENPLLLYGFGAILVLVVLGEVQRSTSG